MSQFASPEGVNSPGAFEIVKEAEPVMLELGSERIIWAALAQSRLLRTWTVWLCEPVMERSASNTACGKWWFFSPFQTTDRATAETLFKDRYDAPNRTSILGKGDEL
jgi:hypothetical protein